MTKYMLLLHGYTQNAVKFHKTITKLLNKTFLEQFVVICPDGCYIVDREEQKYGWWKLSDNIPHRYFNFEKAVSYVRDQLSDMKSDDTLDIISFSQGTILAEYMLTQKLFPVDPQKVIMFSPSGIMDNRYNKGKQYVTSDILIIFGQKEGEFGLNVKYYDKVTCIENYETYLHPAGHVIPLKSEYKNLVKDFLT